MEKCENQGPELELGVLGLQRKEGHRCSIAGRSPFILLQRAGVDSWQRDISYYKGKKGDGS